MIRILLSLLVIAVVSVMSVGATKAYWNSDVTISQVTVATGTLHIKNSSQDWMMQVKFDGLKPGSLIRKWVVIENDGTLDVDTLTVSAVNKTDPSNLLGQLNGWTYGTIAGTSDDPNGVQTGYNSNASVLLNNANLLSPANHILHPEQHTTVQVQFVVPDNLGDTWQGKSATFDLLFHAEQVH
jgi:predicted ribosomally synthesized peptide with SipW-like signal peptide